jgi:TonB family protein
MAMIPFAPGRLILTPPARNAPEHANRNHGPLDLSLGPAALDSFGAPPRTSKGMDAAIRVEGAEVGDDWIVQLHEWWERHKYYPLEAIRNGDEGELEIHMVIRRDGVVESVEVVHPSGSRLLDSAGASVFRNAHLQPFPLSTPEPKADVYVELHYIIIRG